MIEHILFLPTIIAAYQKQEVRALDQLARDFSIILLVNVLEKAGFQIFRRVFVSAVCLGLFTEIINDLCFRAIDPNPKFADNWNHVHKERTKHLLNFIHTSLQTTKTPRSIIVVTDNDFSPKNKDSVKTFEYTTF
jgi:hypothetical protein